MSARIAAVNLRKRALGPRTKPLAHGLRGTTFNLRGAVLLAFCLTFVLSEIFAQATTLKDLQQADKLRMQTWIEPGENIVARQRVNLQIEISTANRFTSGTKIGAFEVKDAIVLQRERFAVDISICKLTC